MMKLRQVGKYSGRHKGEGEKVQCPRCMYEKHEAGQKCPAEERTCNTCGDRGHFGMSKLCKKKKKKKAARRVKEEQKETTSKDSDTRGGEGGQQGRQGPGLARDERQGQGEERQAHHGGAWGLRP